MSAVSHLQTHSSIPASNLAFVRVAVPGPQSMAAALERWALDVTTTVCSVVVPVGWIAPSSRPRLLTLSRRLVFSQLEAAKAL